MNWPRYIHPRDDSSIQLSVTHTSTVSTEGGHQLFMLEVDCNLGQNLRRWPTWPRAKQGPSGCDVVACRGDSNGRLGGKAWVNASSGICCCWGRIGFWVCRLLWWSGTCSFFLDAFLLADFSAFSNLFSLLLSSANSSAVYSTTTAQPRSDWSATWSTSVSLLTVFYLLPGTPLLSWLLLPMVLYLGQIQALFLLWLGPRRFSDLP